MLFAFLMYGAVALVMSLIRLAPSLNSDSSEQENQLLQASQSLLREVRPVQRNGYSD
jgi:hypothetical protein